MKIEVRDFDLSFASALESLSQRAFEAVSPGAQPSQSAEFIAHILGVANPAGVASIAIALDEGEVVGSLAAIPARFRRGDGDLVTGRQIGYFFVDHRYQSKGLGGKLLKDLTDANCQKPGSFLYTYPNKRSIGRFERPGYQRIASIPTFIYLPIPRMLMPSRSALVRSRDAMGKYWKLEELNAVTVQMTAQEHFSKLSEEIGFVRDGKYFCWRFCGPDANRRYRFIAGYAVEGDEYFIVVLAHHHMAGIDFSVLVDILSRDILCNYGMAVKVVRQAGNAWFVYANTNLRHLPGAKLSSLPLGVSIPGFVNPRPVELLWLPKGSAVSREDLVKSVSLTADWLGF